MFSKTSLEKFDFLFSMIFWNLFNTHSKLYFSTNTQHYKHDDIFLIELFGKKNEIIRILKNRKNKRLNKENKFHYQQNDYFDFLKH